MSTCLPLRRNFSAVSACLPQMTMLCHSVLDCFSPWGFFQVSVVATEKRARAWPEGVTFSSGSRPKFPINITLFNEPDMRCLQIAGGALRLTQSQPI